jgi:hypothetical protein
MAYKLNTGIEVSINNTTWYKLTDHNREEIDISPTLIEKEQRMANGTLRKFVISKKDVISTSWDFVPTLSKESYIITNLTAQSGILVYTTSVNHNFANNSIVKVSGINDISFNLTSAVSVGTAPTNTFAIAGQYSGPDFTLSGSNIGSAEQFTTALTTVDNNYGASWLTAFYNANVGNPIYVKITSSRHNDPSIGTAPTDSTYVSSLTGSKTYQAFITNFSRSVIKRTSITDYVNMSIEFTEI